MILGSVDIKPSGIVGKVKRSVGLASKTKNVVLTRLTAKRTYEICKAFKDVESLQKGNGENLKFQVADRLPILTHIIVLTQYLNETEAQKLKLAILDQWDHQLITESVQKIYNSLDFVDMLGLFQELQKIKSVGL
ncbi:hypothetical protein ACS126_09890 [Sphingobacterium lactis]|uniref:hypothetical protein n=1 Tax=Sphingobacterium lactis TaxID=797291 RepID=UPI003EC5C9D2